MGLTKRQEEMISEIIVEESRMVAASQHERHRILSELDEPRSVVAEAPAELGPALRGLIQDLVETFVASAPLYEGHELDDGASVEAAARYLQRLLENDVREARQMLVDGDFGEGA